MLGYNCVLNIILGLVWLIVAVNRRACRAQEALLKELEHFLPELAEQYARCADMREALEQSCQTCSGSLQSELLELTDALEHDRVEEQAYGSGKRRNAYVMLLFSLCHTIRTYGDLQVGGVSLFIYNIRYIKEEVRVELLRRQEGHYAFLGLTALAFLPFFFCLPIQWWSHSVSSSLDRFYVGSYGFVTLTVCFLLAVICVVAVQELQYPVMPDARRHTIEQRLLELPAVQLLVDRQIAAHYSRYLQKNEQLKVLQGYGNIREFLVKKVLRAWMCASAAGVLAVGSRLVRAHQHMGGVGAGGSIPAALVMIAAAGLLGYFLPDARLIILRARVEYQKMEETLRFETLILIVIHYSQVTVEELLRQMERFSVVFSRALQRAVDDFSYHRQESLERLGGDLGYEPAKKLADGLLACDDLPLAQVFHDIEDERAYNMESFKRKALDLQREKAAFARIIAFLPFVAVLVLRLVVPFVLEGLTQLNQY